MDKWGEMDDVWKEVGQDGDASLMALGMKKSFAHDLVGMAVKGCQTWVGTLKEQPLIYIILNPAALLVHFWIHDMLLIWNGRLSFFRGISSNHNPLTTLHHHYLSFL